MAIMNPKQLGAIRRAVIYAVVGYGGLAVINNSGLAPDRMWTIYLPLFVGVYFFARWADSKIAAFDQQRQEKKSKP
jgi:hypothetical protein